MSTNNMNNKPWRQSSSGIKIYPLHPELTEIKVEDIRTAYQNIRRWGGQYDITLEAHCRACQQTAGWFSESVSAYDLGYFHDAHEAYIGDVPSPCGTSLFFKRDDELISLAQLKDEWDARIFDALNIQVTDEDKLIVNKIDKIGGRVEAICFTRNVDGWASITQEELPIAERYIGQLLLEMNGMPTDINVFATVGKYKEKLLAHIKD
jgi:hypothetical protein